jgi:lipoate-protein ligase A
MPGRPAGSALRYGLDVLAEDWPSGDAAANLAMEEALVRAGPSRPLLRVWRNSQCVVVGRVRLLVAADQTARQGEVIARVE